MPSSCEGGSAGEVRCIRYELLLQFRELEKGIRSFQSDGLVINRLHGRHFVVDGLENILVFDRQRNDWLDKPSDEADIIAHSLRLSQNNEYT